MFKTELHAFSPSNLINDDLIVAKFPSNPDSVLRILS
jgi:hypothetical protein